MRTVGLTGGIACGKSTVARLLADRGVPVLDADQVARQVVEPGTPGLAAIVARFGDDVLQPDGHLDRKRLGALVFQDTQARRALEEITHPLIRQHTIGWMRQQAEAGAEACVVEAALLVETGGHRFYDELIVVGCEPETQLARLLARDELDEAAARARIAAQLPIEEKARHATELIDNRGSEAELSDLVDAAWARILAR